MDGGEANQTLSGPFILRPIYSIYMSLRAKEKRNLRRQADRLENQFQANSRGMDIIPFTPKTEKQNELWEKLSRNTVTVVTGPAGVGKTLTILWFALQRLSLGHYEKIYYVRSDVGVEFQRGRGALPGTMEEKMAPLIGPVCDNLPLMTRSPGAADYLLSKKIVHPILLEDVRGRSFNNCFVIFDEAQNATPDQVKTVISRVGEKSKIALTGDTRQIDLRVFDSRNGLVDAYNRLQGIVGVGRLQFSHEDIVRNGILADILLAYES
jgi:phosphate starvation-inducible PhoH-like protein